MGKFLAFFKGKRTKITLIADALFYAVAQIAPEVVSVGAWHQAQPIFLLLAGLFGVEHFEKKD